jgi:hypothetical protein
MTLPGLETVDQAALENFWSSLSDDIEDADPVLSKTAKMTFPETETLSEREREFFALLIKQHRIILDFNGNAVWVLENYENEKDSKKFYLKPDYLSYKTVMQVLSLSDFIRVLTANKIYVDIRNYP